MAEGHRERVKRRFLTEDLERFEAHNALEFLLFYGLPRIDTNGIAHRLIDRFGSFSEVLEAPLDELASVDGVGDNAAIFLKLIHLPLLFCLEYYRYFMEMRPEYKV